VLAGSERGWGERRDGGSPAGCGQPISPSTSFAGPKNTSADQALSVLLAPGRLGAALAAAPPSNDPPANLPAIGAKQRRVFGPMEHTTSRTEHAAAAIPLRPRAAPATLRDLAEPGRPGPNGRNAWLSYPTSPRCAASHEPTGPAGSIRPSSAFSKPERSAPNLANASTQITDRTNDPQTALTQRRPTNSRQSLAKVTRTKSGAPSGSMTELTTHA